MNSRSLQTLAKEIDEAKAGKFHRRIVLITGLGFFTDAYDLFIIGIVSTMLPISGWTVIDNANLSILSSIALFSAVIGALVFGRFIDRFGRKKMYGFELILLIIGALGSAFLTPYNGIYIMMFWRFILGIGIGGDYASSSTIMAEYANREGRGRMIGMVFSMQSLGLLAGPLISLGLIFSGLNLGIIWKLLLAFGAIPALIVVYQRRTMSETPRYLMRVKGDNEAASKTWSKYSGISDAQAGKVSVSTESWFNILKQRRFLLTLIGTAGTWFLMDWALYGNIIMSHEMLKDLVPSGISALGGLIRTTEYSGMIFAFAAFPGYWIATYTVDIIGRKVIQVTGFAAMGISFAILGIFHQLLTAQMVVPFLIIYGLSYFFIEFGPNVTTFIYPPEVFPTKVRGMGTGASAAGGKVGAFVGTFLNVIILGSSIGESGLFIILAALSFLGLILTVTLLPEPRRISLDQSSGEDTL